MPGRAWALAIGAAGMILAGCTPEMQLAGSQPFSPEWCTAAKAFPRSGQYLYAVGQCHERGVAGFAQDDNVINYYYGEAARWGHVEAGAALAARGLPVPDDDLRREAEARRAQERNTRIIADAIRPPAPPRPQHPSVLFPGSPSGPRIIPSTTAPPSSPTVRRPDTPARPSVDIGRPGVTVRRENRTESVRRNCTNNVCRVERTVCIDGRCTTTVSDR
jgi:hypothetical protein